MGSFFQGKREARRKEGGHVCCEPAGPGGLLVSLVSGTGWAAGVRFTEDLSLQLGTRLVALTGGLTSLRSAGVCPALAKSISLSQPACLLVALSPWSHSFALLSLLLDQERAGLAFKAKSQGGG